MKNNFEGDNHHYVAIEVDGQYIGIRKVEYGKSRFRIVSGLEHGIHRALICKATESISGYLEIGKIYCEELVENEHLPIRKIEFIGNSITCGAQSDTSQVGCNEGIYNDHMNAYLAYGSRVSRKLNADYVLSSVSGLGLTRTWNAEHPTIPEVYESLYLTEDKNKLWEPDAFVPDLVSICLGTNDFSEGDGSYDRKPIDQVSFVNTYIDFVKFIHDRYPGAKICLLNSPVFSGETREKLDTWLDLIVKEVNTGTSEEIAVYYTFEKQYNSGCTGHPSIEEHKEMADELLTFYSKIMNW
jgi:lysophospholipase L1-like esterase